MADIMVEKVMKITKNPKQIRNICTSAHIHHGKCISKDSRLILNDGKTLTAEEIFNFSEKNGNLFENKENEHIIYDVSKLGLTAFSVNKETYKIEKKPITLAWKLVGGTTIKLRLRNGAGITTTPEHKYVVYRNSEIIKVEAKDLILGDMVLLHFYL